MRSADGPGHSWHGGAPPQAEELLKVQMETGQYVSAGPEDEFEPDWGAGPGAKGLKLPSIAAGPVDHGSADFRHRLTHGARLGIEIGGVLMRVGDVRNPERCGFRPGAEDWVAMMNCSLGDTNVHIISRVSGSGTEWRLKDYWGRRGSWRGLAFLRTNSTFAAPAVACMARAWC